MTDNEIIKALNGADGLEHISIYCADNNGEDVTSIKIVDIIDLINRQQAEIERLKAEIEVKDKIYQRNTGLREKRIFDLVDELKTAKTKAIKEFAERLKAKGDRYAWVVGISKDEINHLVKEMTEGNQ